MKFASAALFATVVLIHNTAHAHHSTAIYDITTKIDLEGTIKKYEWANPHVYLWLDTQDEKGEHIVWLVEGAPPAMLNRRGISRDMIAEGERITVHGNPGRAVEKHLVLMNSLEKADKKELSFGQAKVLSTLMGSSENASVPATSIAGNWGSLVDMKAFGSLLLVKNLVLTEQGKQALADAKVQNAAASSSCVEGSAPTIMIAPDLKHIEFKDNVVLLSREWDGLSRTVHLNQTSHTGMAATTQGHSIGHWEDGTLVIDTAAFTANIAGNGVQMPSSTGKHLVEKLRLSDDKTHLLYSFVLEDAVFLAEPLVSGVTQWSHRPDLKYSPLPCDPANARRFTE